MTISDEELARLETLAQAATPGPWHAHDCSGEGHWQVDEPLVVPSSDGDFLSESNAALIASARDAVPALAAEVREMYKHAANMATLLGEARQAHDDVCAERDALRAENERLHNEKADLQLGTAQLTLDCRELRAENERLRASLADAVGRMERMEPLLQRCVQVIQAVAPDHEVLDAVDAYEASLPSIVKVGS